MTSSITAWPVDVDFGNLPTITLYTWSLIAHHWQLMWSPARDQWMRAMCSLLVLLIRTKSLHRTLRVFETILRSCRSKYSQEGMQTCHMVSGGDAGGWLCTGSRLTRRVGFSNPERTDHDGGHEYWRLRWLRDANTSIEIARNR